MPKLAADQRHVYRGNLGNFFGQAESLLEHSSVGKAYDLIFPNQNNAAV